MNELIKVDYSKEQPVVSARELHEFLEVGTPYHKWFPRMCEYGFTQNVDFAVTDISVHNSAGGPQTMKDAAITIDMAKEICMLQRNEKGKQARQYFIQLEKDWNSPEKVMARALKIADQKIKTLKATNVKLEAENARMQPKALFADAVGASTSTILIGDLAKILRQNGIDIGQNRLFDWLRRNGYLISRKGESWNMPTQRSMDMGLFRVKESVVEHADGHTTISKTTLVTGRGQQHLINVFLGETQEQLII